MTYQFESNTSMVIDLNAMISHVLGRSQSALEASAIREAVDHAIHSFGSQLEMCQGHDLIRLLGRGLRHRWGSCAEFDSTSKCHSFEKIIRVAYEEADFESSELHACLQAWQLANSPYRLF
jgi:hypothetical protein